MERASLDATSTIVDILAQEDTMTTSPTTAATPASRVQLALNVSDLEASVAFYSAMFGVRPHKRRPGYANFAIADPPLKLVLIEGAEGGTLNHLGVETETAGEVAEAERRQFGARGVELGAHRGTNRAGARNLRARAQVRPLRPGCLTRVPGAPTITALWKQRTER